MTNQIALDKVQIWGQVLTSLSQKLSKMEFNTWFRQMVIKEISGSAMLLGCPNEMNKNWMETKYHNMLLNNIQKIVPEIDRLFFEVDLQLGQKKEASNPEAFREVKPRKIPNQPAIRLESGLESRLIQKKFTLQNFIVGEENRFAHAACSAISESDPHDPKKYNPLYIYGGVGLGKTHLLQATANEIHRRNLEAIVVYTTAERFTNEMVQAIAKKRTDELRKKYRRVDVLLIDDVQFFAGKDQTQVEVFNTFNDLRDQEKQMIFSGDRPPAQLDGIVDRLSSRLGWGLIVDIAMPAFETKAAIVQSKALDLGLVLPNEVVELIALNIRKNLRELENILNKISIEQDLGGVSPTVQTVGKIFRKLNPNDDLVTDGNSMENRLAKNADDVITIISDYFQVPATDLLGTSRRQEIVYPRQICWLLCKDVLKMSLEAIGEAFGGKNHTTIMHGVKKIEGLIRTDSATARNVHALRKDLGVK